MPATLALAFLLAAAHAPPPTLSLDTAPSSNETQPAAETSPPLSQPPFGITGDWFGTRLKLADAGLSFAGSLQLDTSLNLHAGRDTDKPLTRYLLDLNITLDTAKALNLPGGSIFLDLQSHTGTNASDRLAGDTQGFDNLDGPHFLNIAQLWYQQKLLQNILTLKAGKIDANADFSVIEHGKEFLNSAFAFSPTMYSIPTYPDPAGGFDLFLNPNPNLYLGLGAFYSSRSNTLLNIVGNPQLIEHSAGGMFFISELGARWNLASSSLPGHAALGAWFHNGRFPDSAQIPTSHSGSEGLYGLADQSLWEQTDSNGKTLRSLAAFTNFGWADPDTNPISQQLGAGLAFAGLLPSRTDDILGIAATWAQLANPPGLIHNHETTFELFYKCTLLQGASLKPDLQYILHPAGAKSDALILTVRAELDF